MKSLKSDRGRAWKCLCTSWSVSKVGGARWKLFRKVSCDHRDVRIRGGSRLRRQRLGKTTLLVWVVLLLPLHGYSFPKCVFVLPIGVSFARSYFTHSDLATLTPQDLRGCAIRLCVSTNRLFNCTFRIHFFTFTVFSFVKL